MFNFLTKAISGLFIGLASLFGSSGAIQPQFGAVAPTGSVPAVFETYLASQQATGDSTMTLASSALRDGTSLSGYVCFTIDSNTPTLEYECGTVSGTSVTGILRGIDATTGTTSVASLIYTHRRGADVKITDYPALTIATNQLNGTQTIPNLMTYANTVLIGAGTATNTIATVDYVNKNASAGAAPITSITAGIGMLATAAQAALGTATGVFNTITYNLLLPASMATSTPGVQVTNVIPVTGTNQKLSQAFLDLTQAFTFSGKLMSTASSTFTATTTFNGSNVLSNATIFNGVPYAWPSAQGASNTVLKNDGSGNISWGQPTRYSLSVTSGPTAGTTGGTYATSTQILNIPAGTLSASSTITFLGNVECDSNSGSTPTCIYYIRDSGGTTLASCSPGTLGAASYTGSMLATIANQSSLSSQTAISNCTEFNISHNTDPFFVASTNTSSFNTANVLNLVVVAFITGGANGQSNVNSYSLIVNP